MVLETNNDVTKLNLKLRNKTVIEDCAQQTVNTQNTTCGGRS